MKKTIILSVIIITSLIGFQSCEKSHLDEKEIQIESKLNADEAKILFTKILSKAMYNERDLRAFVKHEALKQIDNDYDVFYPFVKDKMLTNGFTFRDMLIKYSDGHHELLAIEATTPLLNILIPDFKIFHDFNAENWDIDNPEIAIAALVDSEEQIFYDNGEEFRLPKTDIPGFPTLVVKDNERLKLKEGVKTKSIGSVNDYEFVDDAYDRRLNTKNFGGFGYRPQNFFNYASNSVIQAYYAFGVDKQYWQRDYIYWGMTKTKPKDGVFNNQVREYIQAIKIEGSAFSKIADQAEDPKVQDVHIKSNDKNPLGTNYADIARKLWTDGSFEIVITVKKGGGIDQEIKFTVHPYDLFDIGTIRHTVKKKLLNRNRHVYSMVNPLSSIKGKWFYPYNGNGQILDVWDITKESLEMRMYIVEEDVSEEITTTKTVKNTYMNENNFKLDFGLGGIVSKITKLDLGMSNKNSQSQEVTETILIKSTRESDDLGNLTFYYFDPIFINDSLEPHISTTGSVSIAVLPKPL